jgi:hypothetical protein
MGKRSYRALVLVVLLLTGLSVTLVHWHSEWTGQGCDLCHVRNLTLVTNPVSGGPATPAEAEVSWFSGDQEYTPQLSLAARPTRAPPLSFAIFA